MGYVVLFVCIFVCLFVCLFAGDTSKCNWDLGSLILKLSWASMKLVLIVTLESLETRLDQGVATLNCGQILLYLYNLLHAGWSDPATHISSCCQNIFQV